MRTADPRFSPRCRIPLSTWLPSPCSFHSDDTAARPRRTDRQVIIEFNKTEKPRVRTRQRPAGPKRWPQKQQQERLPVWGRVLLNRAYRHWCCTDTLHPPLRSSPPPETESEHERLRRFHLQPAAHNNNSGAVICHRKRNCISCTAVRGSGIITLTFYTYSQAESAESGGRLGY